jgi:hypothetical protein
MTKYEHLRNKIDNLRRGLAVRNLTAESIRFWESVLHQLESKIDRMSIEEAGETV